MVCLRAISLVCFDLIDYKDLLRMDADEVDLSFDLGEPFPPFVQLLAVLPPKSRTLVPDGLRDLMVDPSSPIIDFYPDNFETDLNGKKNDWEAVVLIPFIDQTRLMTAFKGAPLSRCIWFVC